VHRRPRSPSSHAGSWEPRQAFLIPWRDQGTRDVCLRGRRYSESPTAADHACRAFGSPGRPSWPLLVQGQIILLTVVRNKKVYPLWPWNERLNNRWFWATDYFPNFRLQLQKNGSNSWHTGLIILNSCLDFIKL
jgi:hypothetical protein